MVLEKNFDGKASKLVEASGKSAAKLVQLMAQHFPGRISFCPFSFTLFVRVTLMIYIFCSLLVIDIFM